MFKNYLRVAWRNLLRNKVFSIINIAGLAIGLAACLMIVQYVYFEQSYDQFHHNGSNIYRVTLERIQESSRTLIAANHPSTGPALKAAFPEVKNYARMLHQSLFMGQVTSWSYEDNDGNLKVFNEERVYDVDSTFLSIFSFPFVYGDPKKCLSTINDAAISESLSHKFFGSENPIGKVLRLDGGRSVTVTGVFKDIPDNSHMQFDILMSSFLSYTVTNGPDHRSSWKWPEFYTYILLDEKADVAEFEAKLPAFAEQVMGARMKEMQWTEQFRIQPITDIHLHSPVMTKERVVHGSAQNVYFLMIIAGLIVLIAWVNYINLSTAKSIQRALEVGVRKVAGASRSQLIRQFLFESALLNFVAVIISLGIVAFAWPAFIRLTGKNISPRFYESPLLVEPSFWALFAGTFVAGSFLAGLYPAFVLSSFRMSSILKGKFFGTKAGIALRKSLVGVQFIITIALMAGTIVVFRQVEFMRNQDLGYTTDQLLVVKAPRVTDSTATMRMNVLKSAWKQHANVHSVAATSEIPGKLLTQSHWIRNIKTGIAGNFLAQHFYIDHEFIPTYGIELLEGRNFSEEENISRPELRTTPVPIILNRKAVQAIGYKEAADAVDQLFYFGLGSRDDWVGKIVGVVDNHHQRSLKQDYDPIIFFPVHNYFGQYITLNITNSGDVVPYIRDHYEKLFPGNMFEYFFLDDYFNRQYAFDQQFGKVFGLFSTLAVFVASLGLSGMSTFIITQRTKEIAIRRVLGARLAGMVYLFSRDSLLLIVVANFITLPLVYIGAQRWLNNFAFHVNVEWILFLSPTAVLVIISLATIGFQTIATASATLMKSLRAE
jgi:putative ABC transport system permease protein